MLFLGISMSFGCLAGVIECKDIYDENHLARRGGYRTFSFLKVVRAQAIPFHRDHLFDCRNVINGEHAKIHLTTSLNNTLKSYSVFSLALSSTIKCVSEAPTTIPHENNPSICAILTPSVKNVNPIAPNTTIGATFLRMIFIVSPFQSD
jgi:hypothetical protein